MWLDQFEKMFDSSPPQANETGEYGCGDGEYVAGCGDGEYVAGCGEGECGYGDGEYVVGCGDGECAAGGDQMMYEGGDNGQCYEAYDNGQCYEAYDNGQCYEGSDQMMYDANAEQQFYEDNHEVEGCENYYDNDQIQTNHDSSNFCNHDILSDQKFISTTPYTQYQETENTLSTTTPCSSLYDSQYQTADQLHSDSTMYNTDQCIHTYNVINTVENVHFC